MVVALIAERRAGLGVGAGAEPWGDRLTDVELHRRVGELELLRIVFTATKSNCAIPASIMRLTALISRAADADHADHGQVGGDVAGNVESRRAFGIGARSSPGGAYGSIGAVGTGSIRGSGGVRASTGSGTSSITGAGSSATGSRHEAP